MDRVRFNLGNSGILESTQEYSGMTQGSYGNDSGMTQEYLGDSGRVWDMTGSISDLRGKIINISKEGNKLLRDGNAWKEEGVGTIDSP